MRVRAAASRIVLAAVAFSTMVLAAPAHADGTTDLGIDDFGAIVADAARDQLVISGGIGETHLTFVDLDGAVTASDAGFDGPSGLAIVGSTLYVLEHGAGRITPVDLATRTTGAAITSALSGRFMLGAAGGFLWTSGAAGVDRIDPATGTVTTFTGQDYPTGTGVVDLATDPTDASRLAVAEEGESLRIYDATASPPAVLAETTLATFATPRFTADGASIVVSTGASVRQLDAGDLSVEHTYPGLHPNGTSFVFGVDAVDRDGDYVATLTSFGGTVFAGSNDDPVFSSSESPFVPMPRGISLGPTGDRLYVVSRAPNAEMQLFTFDDPTLFGSSMTIDARDRVRVFTPIRVSGQLTFDDGPSVGAGEPVDIRVSHGGSTELVATVDTEADGTWSTEIPTDADGLGLLDVRARYDGDAEHRGSVAMTSVIVGRLKRELTLTASRRSIDAGERVRLGVRLELSEHGGSREVRIYRRMDGVRRLLDTITVGDAGRGWLVDRPRSDAAYQAIVVRDDPFARSVSGVERVSVR